MGIVMLLALALAVPAGATSTSGLRGVVMRGPITPVCQLENPCDAPAKHVTLVFERNDVSRSVTTDEQGHYLIKLHPGTWSVHISSGRGFKPQAVYVRTGVVRSRTSRSTPESGSSLAPPACSFVASGFR